jgi:hypothetical protein
MPPTLNLTCQQTHILAWANLDNTLSLKINGVKYLAWPKVDKRGGKYWKTDTNSAAKVQITKAEIDLICQKPLSEQTREDREKWAKYVEQERLKEQKEAIEDHSQKVLEQLAAKITNHEPNSN